MNIVSIAAVALAFIICLWVFKYVGKFKEEGESGVRFARFIRIGLVIVWAFFALAISQSFGFRVPGNQFKPSYQEQVLQPAGPPPTQGPTIGDSHKSMKENSKMLKDLLRDGF